MKLVAAILVVALVAAAAAQNAGLSRTVAAEDKSAWKALAEGAQKEDGTFESMRDAYYAVEVLEVVGSRVARKGDVCKQVKAVLAAEDQDVLTLFFAVEVGAKLGCLQPPSSAASSTILSAVQSPEGQSAATLYCAVHAGLRLRENKLLSRFDTAALPAVIEVLAELFDDERMEVLDAAVAYSAAAAAAAALDPVPADTRGTLEVMAELVMDTLAVGEEQEDGSVMFSSSSTSSLLVTSALVRGVYAFDAVQSSDLPNDLGSSVGEWLLQHATPTTVEDAFAVASGLAAIDGAASDRPLALVCETSSVSALAKAADVVVAVSDMWGGAVPGAASYLLSASLQGKQVVANQDMRSLGDGKFGFNILAAKPTPGHYLFSLTASSTSSKYATVENAQCVVRVSLPVKVSPVTFTVKDTQYDEVVMSTKGSKKSHFEAAAFHDVTAEFTVSGDSSSSKPVAVQQAFLVFDSEDGSVEAVVPAVFDGKRYTAAISMMRDGEQFQFHTGRYTVRLFVADAFVENAVMQELGEAKLRFPAGLENKVKHHTVYEHKADIEHQFRKPDSRPPQSFSWMFTLVVLSPIAVLLIGILTAFPNVSIPTSSVGFVSSVAFIACIALGGLVLWLYWVRWNLFEATQAMAVVMLAGTVFGKYALRARQENAKVKEE